MMKKLLMVIVTKQENYFTYLFKKWIRATSYLIFNTKKAFIQLVKPFL